MLKTLQKRRSYNAQFLRNGRNVAPRAKSFLEDEGGRLQQSDESPLGKVRSRARESLGGTSARGKGNPSWMFLERATRFPSLDMVNNSLTSSPCKSARDKITAAEPSMSFRSSSAM